MTGVKRKIIVSANMAVKRQKTASEMSKGSSGSEEVKARTLHEDILREQLEAYLNNPAKKDRGSAPSRGRNETYNGSDKDRLWNGGRRNIPAGLVQSARGKGNDDENSDDENTGGRDEKDGDGGGGGTGGGGGEETRVATQSRADVGVSRMATYFIPGDGIDGEVITTDICRYLGPDALIKPGSYKDPKQGDRALARSGFFVTAYRPPTSDQLFDIRLDSARRIAERAECLPEDAAWLQSCLKRFRNSYSTYNFLMRDCDQPLAVALDKQVAELGELLARLQYQPSNRIELFLKRTEAAGWDMWPLPKLLSNLECALSRMHDGQKRRECKEIVRKLLEIVEKRVKE